VWCVVCEHCIIEKCVFQKLFYKCVVYWGLASDVRCLLFHCASWWTDLSDCFHPKSLDFLQVWILLSFFVLSHFVHILMLKSNSKFCSSWKILCLMIYVY
jgi:hypothetical protein